MPLTDRLGALREAVRGAVPEGPGVYTWFGASGEALYVGKSVNLRARMLSYLTPENTGPRARLRGLVSAIAGFAWEPVAGELLALLVEDARIKELQPRHNMRQRDYLERRYLLVTDDEFPALLCVETPGARTGTLFGPFKDQYMVAGLIELLTSEFGLRTCIDRVPFRHSARYDLGTCLGPCRGAISAEAYRAGAERACAFLRGDTSWILPRLEQAMEQAADDLRFEDASAIRERRDFCERFGRRQAFFQEFTLESMAFTEERFGLTYRFDQARLVALRASDGTTLTVPETLRVRPEDPRVLLDRANVVYAWLGRRSGQAAQ